MKEIVKDRKRCGNTPLIYKLEESMLLMYPHYPRQVVDSVSSYRNTNGTPPISRKKDIKVAGIFTKPQIGKAILIKNNKASYYLS